MFASLNISSIINLFFTFSMILLVYFYLKKRLDCVENKVDIMFNLIQEHQKQIKMQEIINTNNVCNKEFCNVSDFSLPMCKDKECNEEHVNDDKCDSDESENSDSQSEEENETDDESDDDIQIGEILSQDIENNNTLDVVDVDDVDVEKNIEQEQEKEEEKEREKEQEEDNKENKNQEVSQVNIADNDVVEPTEQNVNNWTQNSEGDNITVLEDNNNNKIKISIVKNIDSNIDYSKLKVQELKKLASERNIVGYSSLKKKELIKLLE